jgi:hypothetical protein
MRTPAAGRIDSNHACMHDRLAPIRNLLSLTTRQLREIDTTAEGNSMKTLPRPAHIDTHGDNAGGI